MAALSSSWAIKWIYLNMTNFEAPSSAHEGDRHIRSRTFLGEIRLPTTFAFLNKMRIFGNVEPQNESNFPFLYIIRFQTYWSLEPPSSTRGGDRHMRSLTFLSGIRFRTTFTWSFFSLNTYFWQCWAPKCTNFPIIIY